MVVLIEHKYQNGLRGGSEIILNYPDVKIGTQRGTLCMDVFWGLYTNVAGICRDARGKCGVLQNYMRVSNLGVPCVVLDDDGAFSIWKYVRRFFGT